MVSRNFLCFLGWLAMTPWLVAATIDELEIEDELTENATAVNVRLGYTDFDAEIDHWVIRVVIVERQTYLETAKTRYAEYSAAITDSTIAKILSEQEESDLAETTISTPFPPHEILHHFDLIVPLTTTSLVYLQVTAYTTNQENQEILLATRSRLATIDREAPFIGGLSITQVAANQSFIATATADSPSDLAEVQLTLMDINPALLIANGGVLDSLDSSFSATEQLMVPGDPDQHLFSATFTTTDGAALPRDRLLFFTVMARDLSGNARTYFDVFTVADIVPLDIASLTLTPVTVTLAGFGQSTRLTPVARLTNDSEIVLTAVAGISFVSNNPDAAVVDATGLVTGVLPGDATITVDYLGFTASAQVQVQDQSHLVALSVTNAPLTLSRVGEQAQLQVMGRLSDNQQVPVTNEVYQTTYTMVDEEIAEVSANGLVTGLRPGTTELIVSNPFFPAAATTITISVLDGPPTIALSSNRGSIPENEEFTVTATVTDDLGSDGIIDVLFLVDDVPVHTDKTSPFVVKLRAPEGRAGTALLITAIVTDVANHQVTSEPITVAISGARPLGNTAAGALDFFSFNDHQRIMEALEDDLKFGFVSDVTPVSFGGHYVVGSILDIAVAASDGDFDRVELLVNGVVTGSSRVSRPIRYFPEDDPLSPDAEIAAEFSYRISYIIPRAEAGRSQILIARGYKDDRHVDSPAAIVQAVVDLPPQITVSIHQDQQGIKDGATHTIVATVTDDLIVNGARVDFYVNDVLTKTIDDRRQNAAVTDALSSGGSRQYGFTLMIPEHSVGEQYRIRAVATDSAGQSQVDSADVVNLTVQPNAPPQLQLTSPAAGSEWIAGATLSLQATVADDGEYGPVNYYINGERVAIGKEPQAYVIPPGLAGQNLTVTATVADREGLTDQAEVTIGVVADAIPPAVAIAAPLNQSTIQHTQFINFLLVGYDNLAVAKVELFVHTQTAPIFTATGAHLGVNSDNSFTAQAQYDNTHYTIGDVLTFTAVATDTAGNQTYSSPVTITVVEKKFDPVDITIKLPADQSDIQMELPFDVLTQVPANAKIARVELFLDDTRVAEDTLKPYQFRVTPPLTPDDRDYQLKVVATDIDGSQAEDSVTIHVHVDRTPPLVALHEPVNLARLTEATPLTLVALAADNVALARTEFYVDGQLLATQTSGTSASGIFTRYTTTWTPPLLNAGESERTITLAAQAYDGNNNASALYDLTVTVVADLPPVVTIIEPRENRSVYVGETIQMTVTAKDDVSLATIAVYSGETLVTSTAASGTAGEYPFTITAPPTTMPFIKVIATDNRGKIGFHQISLNVIPDIEPPTCRIITPKSGLEVLENSRIQVSLVTSDNRGIAQIELMLNGQPLSPPVILTTPTTTTTKTVMVANPLSFGQLDDTSMQSFIRYR